MAREIKNNPPGIRSFVFLTLEEALQKYGGSIAFVGNSSKPSETPSIDLPPSPRSKKKTPKPGHKAN